jgi:ubiquinone/menaquinone biosynthesis C-methylase UbiE
MGLQDRVRIARRDAADPLLAGQYDVAYAASCLHDMANPVAVLQAMNRLTGDHGLSVVLESPVPEAFLGEGTVRAVERKLYGYSILHCLPVAMVEQPSAAIGTVMRPDTLRQLARQAGFRDIAMYRIDDWTALFQLRR